MEVQLPDIEAFRKNVMISLKDNLKEGKKNVSESSRKINGSLRGIIRRRSLLLGCKETAILVKEISPET
jgi:hypothetical protein